MFYIKNPDNTTTPLEDARIYCLCPESGQAHDVTETLFEALAEQGIDVYGTQLYCGPCSKAKRRGLKLL